MSSKAPSSGEFDEIISRLRSIQQAQDSNGQDKNKNTPAPIPLIDPTANVLALLRAAATRQDDLRVAENKRIDDLRDQADKFNEKLATERLRADSESKRAEAGRIDALLVANTNNVALALEKQGAQANAQDRRIAVLEQNQYQGVGAGTQRVESRQTSQWLIGLIVGVVFTGLISIIGTALVLFWKH
jgi:hypothetical protein